VSLAAVLAAASAYIYVGWVVSVVAGAAYAVSLVRRGRAAAAQVPEDRRRWSSTAP
jgi:hypothetical protein